MDCRLNFSASRVWIAVLCLASAAAAQIPASFEAPTLGHVFDAPRRAIRPVTGVAGNSRIGARIALPFGIDQVAFLQDQRHAIVSSADQAEVLILDLKTLRSTPIGGAPSSITSMQTGSSGITAAIHYGSANKIHLVNGLPANPHVFATIDLSYTGDRLRQFAFSSDGAVGLLAFSSADKDSLYSWSADRGFRFVTTASRVADLAFSGEDAVVADSGSDQILLIRNVREQASPALVADSREGISQPMALSVSSQNEIYIGNGSGEVVVLDSAGRFLRRLACGCSIRAVTSLSGETLQLTDDLERPLFILDKAT